MLIVGKQIRPAKNTSVGGDETGGILSALQEVVAVRVAPFIAPGSPAEQRQRDDESPLATATRLLGGSLALLNVPIELLGTGFALLTAPLGAAVPPLPAATLASLHLGAPHLHSHPPAMPLPLPSIGPVMLGGCTSVLIGGLPAARAGDLGLSITCGSLAPPFQVMTGSSKVFIGGGRAARSLDITRHCQTPLPPAGAAAKVAAGALNSLPLALGAASAVLQHQQSQGCARDSREYAAAGDTTMAAAMTEVSAGLALGATTQAAQTAVDAVALAARLLMGKDPGTPPCFGAIITGASDVQIGGFPMPPWRVTLGALGKLARGLKATTRNRNLADALHARARANFKPGRIDNALHKQDCFLTGHPVDVIAGRVITDDIDLELTGPLRFGFERNYSSTWSARDSVIGHGWSHSLDQAVWRENRQLVYRAEDGRELCFELPRDARLDRPLRLFDPRNRLTLSSDGDGRYTVEDAAGRLHEFAPVPGDTSGELGHARLVAVRTLAGHAIACDYDARARLHRVRDSAGREYRLTYDRQSRLHRIFIPHPDREGLVRHLEYRYSPDGDLIEVVDALGQTTRYAYHRHRLVLHTLRTGLSFHFEYEGPEPGAACVHTWGDGGIYDHTLVYDKQRRVTVVTNSCGEPTVYAAGGRGEVVQITDPRGGVTRFEFDEHLRKTADIDPLGRVTRYEYDTRGNCTRVVGPDGAQLRVEYGATGLPHTAVDALGGRWRYVHDDRGRLATRTDPLGQTTTYLYEGLHLAAVIDPAGRAVRFVHDAAGALTRVQLPDGTTEAWAYDRRGRPIAWTDVRGNLERRCYDLLDRLVNVDLPDGDRRTYDYDPEGHVLKVSDARRDVRMAYTGMGCLVARTEAGFTVRYAHDTEERLTAITNEAGAVYRFELDPAGDIKAEHGFDGLRRIYRRDLAGRVTEVFRPGGLRTAYARDTAGQLTGVFHSDGSSDVFTYRVDGAMLEAVHVEPDAEPVIVRFERDALGRVVREAQGEHWVEQELGPDGLRSRLRSSLGARAQLSRDVMGAVLRIEAGERAWSASFRREAGGLEAQRDLPGGICSRWQHDPLGLPTEHTIEHLTPARLGARTHTFAHHRRRHTWACGARLGRVDDLYRGAIEYEHDERGFLVSATYPQGQVVPRRPDAAGNLFRDGEHRRTYGPAGQLLKSEDTAFEYDSEGNLIQKTDDAGTWLYRWTASGNLAEVCRPDGERVSFTYDALGRRTSKSFSKDNRRTRWLWDGDVPLHEWTLSPDLPELPTRAPANPADERPLDTSTRSPSADDPELLTWIFEPATFTPVARLSSRAREAVSLVADHLGTPIAAFDTEGRPVWSVALDIHGRVRDVAGDRQLCPFRYPGQYEDTETGLYYNRFRYYDPEAGQYISQDPLGLAAGLAFYAYVPDPLSSFDPLGLEKTFCRGAKRWRSESGRFVKRPDDPAELVKVVTTSVHGKPVRAGSIDYASLMEWNRTMADWNPGKPSNLWRPNPGKFPTGGFSFDKRSPAGTRYGSHGHGANPAASLSPTSNAASGPTTTLEKVHGGIGSALTEQGSWHRWDHNPDTNSVHIPLKNSPF